MWKLGSRRSITERRETRLIIPLEVLVEISDEQGKPTSQEYTVTETVSSWGLVFHDSGRGRGTHRQDQQREIGFRRWRFRSREVASMAFHV